MNPLIKKKLSILIRIATADGEFAKTEKNYITQVAEKNGVSPLELSALYEDPESIGSLGALSYEKIVEYMCDSLSLMMADQKIMQSEVLLCEDIGFRLGFNKKDIDSVIELLRKNPIIISANKLEKEIRNLPHSLKQS